MNLDYLLGWGTHLSMSTKRKDRSKSQARARHAQVSAGHTRTKGTRKQGQGTRMQGQGTRKQGQGTRTQRALCRPVGLCCRTNSTTMHTKPGARYAHTEGIQWKHPGNGTWRVASAVVYLLQRCQPAGLIRVASHLQIPSGAAEYQVARPRKGTH